MMLMVLNSSFNFKLKLRFVELLNEIIKVVFFSVLDGIMKFDRLTTEGNVNIMII